MKLEAPLSNHRSGAMSHAYVQFPPIRCNIPGALGVTYDDANKLLLVPTIGEIHSWSVSSPSSDPVVAEISQGPVLGVRYSLDCKILTVLRSNTEIEFINREDCTSFRQVCKSATERILGFFWTDCPNCDVVIVTTSGLELYSLYLGKSRLKLIEKKRQSVSWFVYTHESRMVLLASGTQCKTLSGYQVKLLGLIKCLTILHSSQFSAGGIVRVPKFDAVLSKFTSVLSSDNVFIATMYGRLYCLQVDPSAKVLRMYRFYRDAVIGQNYLPTYASNVAVSVVDNVLLVHQIDSKVVLLYDILSDSKVPVSAPLPLLVRQQHGFKHFQSRETAEEHHLYGDGWVFVNPDAILDHAHGLLWRIHLDLEAVAASSSDVPSLLGFLQRRRHEASKAKELSLSILKSVIMEKRPLALISGALAVITSASGHAKRSSRPAPNRTPAGRFPSMPLLLTPGIQPAALATALSLGNPEIMNGSFKGIHMSEDDEGEMRSFSEPENQAVTPAVSPGEMYDSVFAVIEEAMSVESSFLVTVMVEYMRSAFAEQLVIPPEFSVLIARLLARDRAFVRLHQLVVSKVLEPSKLLALQLLEIAEQFPELRETGLDMLRQARAHKDYVHFLLRSGRILEGLRYIRQNKVESASCVLFLEAAADEDVELLVSVLRFCCDFVPNFEHTAEFERFYSIVQRRVSSSLS